MRRLLFAAAVLAAGGLTGQGAFAATCVTGASLANYLSLAGGCTIGDKTFSDFTYVSSSGGGAVAIAASGITVSTIDQGAKAIGLQFNAPWSVSGTQSLDSAIGFTVSVTPPPDGVRIHDAGLVQSGTSFIAPGVAQVAENLNNGTNLVTILSANQDQLSNQEAFSPTGSVGVLKDISVNAHGGAASISIVEDTFSQVVPEPASLGLLGVGLIGLGMVVHRRRHV